MATLFRNKNSPVWRARYYDATGRRISKTTGSTMKREAKRIADGYQADVDKEKREQSSMPAALSNVVNIAARKAASGNLTLKAAEDLVRNMHRIANPDFKEFSVKDWYAKWITTQEQYISAATMKGYQEDLNLFVNAWGPRVSEKKLTELTGDDVLRGMAEAHKTVKAATVNKALGSLRRAIQAAYQQDLVAHNVVSKVRALKLTDSTKRGPFTTEEIGLLLDDASTNESFFRRGLNHEWYGLIIMGTYTGMRLGDLLSLRSTHIVGDHLEVVTSKTGHTIKVPLAKPCAKWLKDKEGELFPKLKRQKKGTTSTQFTRIMERAGVERDILHAGDQTLRRSFHSLRHTFTSLLADADIQTDVRQRLTGHKSAGVHAAYTHHEESLNRAIAAIPTDFIK